MTQSIRVGQRLIRGDGVRSYILTWSRSSGGCAANTGLWAFQLGALISHHMGHTKAPHTTLPVASIYAM